MVYPREMHANRVLLGLAVSGAFASGALLEACGGDDATIAPTKDAASDSTIDAASGDSANAEVEAPDSGPPCAPPSDATKSSLCVRVAPEAIHFISDMNLDGKGLMVIDVHAAANPDAPDGAPRPALQTAVLPAQDGGLDAGELDLSAPVPEVRFDGLPATVYPRVIFVDSRIQPKPGAGWWIGGYDLANGVAKAPLKPVTLMPGSGTTITIDLLALRRLFVTLTLGTQPIGNAMGPAIFGVTPDQTFTAAPKVFGLGGSPCANVSDGGALLAGFVLGKGPYYVFALLDDFDAGGFLAPGALTSLSIAEGGAQNPAPTLLNYVPTAYVVSHSVPLGTAVPKPEAGIDSISCP